MSTSKRKENKNIKALFSVICICIISLGLIVYLSTNTKQEKKSVDEQTTITQSTTEAQHAVTVTETTTKAQTTKQNITTTTTTEPSSIQVGENNTPYKSYYKYPLSEAVAKGYSEELVFDDTMQDYRAHGAVDFVGGNGDKVVAVNDGLVTKVYKDDMYGIVVEIDHGGSFVAKYCGLDSASVKKGQYVDIGNAIGTLGKIPCESAQGSHLHFEATYDGKTVNPLDVMGKTE